jgi:hypothetical protein
MAAHYQPSVTTQISALTIIHIQCGWEVGWPSWARRMVDDSEGKAIGNGDCHMPPVWEGTVLPIRLLEFFDPVLRGLPPFSEPYRLLTAS